MGYSYSGAGALVCDNCGGTGGVRKRTCLYKVDGTPYCKPPAVCRACLTRIGGSRVLHQACQEKAAESQRQSDEMKTLYEAGEMFVATAWGDWLASVPEGMTGLMFRGRDGLAYRLADGDEYSRVHSEHGPATRLSHFPGALAWDSYPGARTVA